MELRYNQGGSRYGKWGDTAKRDDAGGSVVGLLKCPATGLHRRAIVSAAVVPSGKHSRGGLPGSRPREISLKSQLCLPASHEIGGI